MLSVRRKGGSVCVKQKTLPRGEKGCGELILLEWSWYVEFCSTREAVKCNAGFQKACSRTPLERTFSLQFRKGKEFSVRL